ncbi:MAG TPA: glycosyltransferase family 2 protein [Opitutaceae bacterium]|jgi:glycosyltransferase involved in cell wall biosynthesis|nr:glycosyltransferase family 2 protein [Opitutaceae bacterium]
MDPLVSIVIPCYNAEPWLGAALDSALAQTWPATEIIVVDDGSRDRSREIARGYENRGVRVLAQANAGASAARNAGLRAARGAYIQFLDADDLLAPGKIEAQVRRLADGGAGVLASGAWARFAGDPAGAEFTPQANWRDLSGVEFLQSNYEEIGMMHPAAWLAPRALLDRIGPWDESLSLNDDGEYFARAALAADRIVFCPDARSLYRSNLGGSLSGRRDRRALESFIRSTELIARQLLAADASARSRAAAAYAWKWAAFEVYPAAPDLARRAEQECRRLGGSRRPFPGSGRFQLAARLLGWRAARRLTAPR